MATEGPRHQGEGAAERALTGAVPSPLRSSYMERAVAKIRAANPAHPYLDAEPASTVASMFMPDGEGSRRRLRALEASGEPFAVSDETGSIRAGDYVLRLDVRDVPRLTGIHQRVSLLYDVMKFILLPATAVVVFGFFALAVAGEVLPTPVAVGLGSLPALLLAVAAYRLQLLRRGAVAGRFSSTITRVHKQPSEIRDIRRSYLIASEAIESVRAKPAWASEVLAGPRAQINLDEEGAQIADFALALEKLHVTLGERPVDLGPGPLALWDERRQVIRDGVQSLKDRTAALVALDLAVEDVDTRLRQLNQLQSSESEDLVGQILGAIANNEIAVAHAGGLAANAAGVAEALRNEVTMMTATADEFARAAASLPRRETDGTPPVTEGI